MTAILRQPLARFVALGLLILCVDSVLGVTEYAEDSGAQTVVVNREVRDTVEARLVASLGRTPSQEEREKALEHWVREEILVREARSLGLDRGDVLVRNRLAETMVYVHRSLQVPPEPSDEELRAVFAEESDRYAVPEKWSLRQLFTGEDRALADRLASRWQAGEDPVELGEEAQEAPGGPVLRGRTTERLEEQFGGEFVRGLAWLETEPVPLRSERGWHVVKVLSRQESKTPHFEEVRDRLAQRWRARWVEEASREATDALLERYEVVGWP